MRGLRFLLLMGAVVVGVVVARDFWQARQHSAEVPEIRPSALSTDLNSRSGRWRWRQQTADASKVEITAEGFRQGKANDVIELTEVELRIFRSDEQSFDRVLTPAATFNLETSLFYSESETVITLDVPAAEPRAAARERTRITTSGVTFDTVQGTAASERETFYSFENGRGRSLGARYDSHHRSFEMTSQARIERFAPDTGVVTVIEAGKLIHYEFAQRIDLLHSAKLDRGDQQITAKQAFVELEDGVVRKVIAHDAKGFHRSDSRQTEFATPLLEAYYSPQQILERATGSGLSTLTSHSGDAQTRASGARIELLFQAPESGQDSVLQEAFLRGQGVIESRTATGEIRRRVESEALRLLMQPGGESLSFLETLQHGRIEIRQGSADPPRTLAAEKLKLHYATDNRMERLEAHGAVSTRRPPPDPQAPALQTWSDELEAAFSPDSGEMTDFRQWGSFRFQRGAQNGSSERAAFLPTSERLVLTGSANIVQPAGSVRADRMTLDQVSDVLTAEGGVASVYSENEAPPGASLFSPDQPVYAAAEQMHSDNVSGLLIYSGNARLWQGVQRVEADEIRIDRQAKTLAAAGQVETLLEESPAAGEIEPAMIEVRSDRLFYQDSSRRALYRGNVLLLRNALAVQADRLDARLQAAKDGQPAGLESAEATGAVQIHETDGRQSFARWARYEPKPGVLFLKGDPARVINAEGEETRGAQLTYYLDDDRLLVAGGEERAYSIRLRN